ncbi:DoxX family protein [Pedobacter sp. HDW13]|uniref:DoxX family protein n=1 Tax=Pedobacter sp. HDW13 TaxID=2714940 RepID=UPI001F0DCA41|nr:DoxX family protein [Pedobacter sp. HDW13]
MMNTKAIQITYWISTALVSLMMVFSAYSYFANPEVKQGFQHVGFPDYFRVELGIAKLLGAIVLLVPIKGLIKEWAYAGFTIVFVSACIAHLASGDTIGHASAPLIFLAVLAVSYFTYHKSKKAN